MSARLLALASLRFYRRHPWQLLLAILGIALGVAVFVGIQLANDSARRAFDASSAAVTGQTTHRLLPLGEFIAEAAYRDLKRDWRYQNSAPILEAPVSLTIPDGTRIELMLEGIDIIEQLAVAGPAGVVDSNADPLRLITTANGILVPVAIVERFGLAPGDALTLAAGDTRAEVQVIGSVAARPDGSNRLLADIATAQEVTGQPGFLSRIDLRLTPEAAESITAANLPGAVLVPASAEDAVLRELTRAFNTNLTALGLLALVVGMFLIYSTISFTIVQRWRSLSVLRALGLDRRELLSKLLTEALAIGCTGTLLGLGLGKALSAGLLELVLRTLDDLYFRRALGEADASAWIFVYSAAIGIGATLLSALVPALAAARREITASTRSRLERSARTLARRFALAAPLTLALGAAILLIAPRSLPAGFLALFLVLIAGAMLVPLATRALMQALETPLARLAGLPGRMATRGVTDSLSRTGIATAALAVAVATVMSIGLMIGSFRASLIEWIDTTVTADLYIQTALETGDAIEPTLAGLEALPGIAGISRMQTTRVTTTSGALNLRAASPGPEGYGIDITAPADGTARELLAGQRRLLISEPLAYRLDLAPGGSIELPTAAGLTSFDVAGIYRDYNTSGSEVILTLDAYRDWYDDPGLSSIGVHLAPGADETATIASIRSLFSDGQRVPIRSTGAIREISLVVFDRTFQVTEVLRLLAAIVAFLGILSAVMALQLEREREFAVLRSLGMSVRQLFGQNLAQTALLGLAAGLAAIPLGIALAWLLVHVINQRSFGWSMNFVVTTEAMLSGVGMAVAAAILAGLYPAFVGARADMGIAWRDD